ncbi:hypothetical protein ACFVVM_28440 [Nocardia sp. NPDC058176]|uniref:DUF7373 family lipoprotein n=1 Tax=Nocardia sp. NPDC058176 TaxID=3346368 RepID=UPI0036DA0545
MKKIAFARRRAARTVTAASVAILALLATGCGSVMSGSGIAGEIDVRELDAGTYPILPVDFTGEYAPTYDLGRELAAILLAEHLVLGPEIDEKLAEGYWMTIKRPNVATSVSEQVRPVLETNRMIYGFGSSSTDQRQFSSLALSAGDHTLADLQRELEPTYFGVTVFQFPGADAASRAATELEQADFDVAPDLNQKVQLDKYANAHAHWRPGVASMLTTVATGSYVINLQVGVPKPELPELIALTEKVLDAQIPRLERLTPKSPEEVLRLSNDPDQILRRVLNPDQFNSPSAEHYATYGLQGYVHTHRDHASRRAAYEQAGVDRIGIVWGSQIFRARDAEAAETLRTTVLDWPGTQPAEAPPSAVPSAQCVENEGADFYTKRFSCAVQYRRYVTVVHAHQIGDAHQRAAAAYGVMANSQ